MNWPLLRFFTQKARTEAQSTKFKETPDTTVMQACICRWETYSNIGEVIPGSRLIAFKVPLAEHYCRKYPDELWFTPDTLIELTKSKNIDLGLVIDLTFTDRYYNRKNITDQGVAYEKIFVPGHVIPDDEIVNRFFTVIDNFLEENTDNDKVVGVHCTHGVNRTGYVVCRYLIDRLGFKPDLAIEACGLARGYPIERENYLEDLKQRPKDPELVDNNVNTNASGSMNRIGNTGEFFHSWQDGRINHRHTGYSRDTRGRDSWTRHEGNRHSSPPKHFKHGRDNESYERHSSHQSAYGSQNHESNHYSQAAGWSNQPQFNRYQRNRPYESNYQSASYGQHSDFNNGWSDFGSYNSYSNNGSYSSRRPRGHRFNGGQRYQNNSYNSHKIFDDSKSSFDRSAFSKQSHDKLPQKRKEYPS